MLCYVQGVLGTFLGLLEHETAWKMHTIPEHLLFGNSLPGVVEVRNYLGNDSSDKA